MIAFAIFILTLAFVIWQPKGLSIGWSAALGAVLSLMAGTIQLSDIPVVWDIVWNATATFIAIIISLLLDEAGWVVLVVLLIGFFGLRSTNIPVSVVAAVSAVALLLTAQHKNITNTRKVLSNAPWAIVVFFLRYVFSRLWITSCRTNSISSKCP